jgi:hypothetical protein
MQMRNLIIIFCLICPGILINANTKSALLISPYTTINNSLPDPSESFAKIASMKVKDIEKTISRKLSLKEKIAFKIIKWKAKKLVIEGEPTEKQRKQGILSLVFGAAGLIFLFVFFPVGIALSIAGLVLGIISLKGNSNVPAILGIVFSGVSILLLLLAIAIAAAWGWY